MKKMIFALTLALSLMSFTSSNEVVDNTLDWTSCTISSSSGATYTVSCDCSAAKACRKARKLMKQYE